LQGQEESRREEKVKHVNVFQIKVTDIKNYVGLKTSDVGKDKVQWKLVLYTYEC